MVTTEPAKMTASETGPPGFHIRWGWFLGCIAAGIVAIVIGWFLAAPAGRINYLTGLLLNVGTTLLLLGIVVLLGFAAGWLTVALGLAAKSPETAGLATVPLVMLPFFSSAIAPADKMGAGVRQFAEYQPFTPIIESVRGLLNDTPSTGYTIAAIAWCVGIAVVGYVWAGAEFSRRA